MAGVAASSGTNLRLVNDSVLLTVVLVKNGAPVTGKTPKVRMIRRSDGKFYNWGLNVWQTPVYSRSLTETAYASGVYDTEFDHGVADPDAEEDYLAVFAMNGAPPDTFYGASEFAFRRVALPGDAMTLTAGERAAIRAAIMTYIVNGNALGLTVEGSLDLIRKILNNRLELADGDTANWKLYDDDDATVLLTYNVRDKSGGPIGLGVGAPARRTRGT